MSTSIVITIIGPDRPGIVSAISDQAVAYGANWTDSLMAEIAGQFAGIVHLQVPSANAEALMAALRKLESPAMRVAVAKGTAGAAAGPTRRLKLDLVGQDRPGIIQAIAGQLAQRGVSIERLHTEIESGAMSGGEIFRMAATLRVPASVEDSDLRQALEGLANELMVDIELDESRAAANP
jgi:glycine cleavage system regulatory protein